jgi:hypothetical protein
VVWDAELVSEELDKVVKPLPLVVELLEDDAPLPAVAVEPLEGRATRTCVCTV